MNRRLDHPVTDPDRGRNREIFKNRLHGPQLVFEGNVVPQALVCRVLGASGTAGSALVGRPTEACSLRPFGSRSSPKRQVPPSFRGHFRFFHLAIFLVKLANIEHKIR